MEVGIQITLSIILHTLRSMNKMTSQKAIQSLFQSVARIQTVNLEGPGSPPCSPLMPFKSQEVAISEKAPQLF